MHFIRSTIRGLIRTGGHGGANSSRPQNPANFTNQEALSVDLNETIKTLRGIYLDCPDVVFRPFWVQGKTKAMLLYIEGLSNIDSIDQYVLAPLMQDSAQAPMDLNMIIEQKLPVSRVEQLRTYADCIEQVSFGNPIVLFDQDTHALAFNLTRMEKRSVEEPTAEAVVRGPREGFTEVLSVNTSLLRRKLRSPQLKFLSIKAGRYTVTEIIVAYVDGIAEQT